MDLLHALIYHLPWMMPEVDGRRLCQSCGIFFQNVPLIKQCATTPVIIELIDNRRAVTAIEVIIG